MSKHNIKFLFNGPLYRGNKETQSFIPLNISLKERVLLEPKKEMIVSMYREIPSFEVFALQEKEIVAEKVRAILTREKPRDVYDLWFLITKKQVVFDVDLINKKLRLYNLKFNLNKFIKVIEAKKNLWNMDLKNLIIHELPNFAIVKSDIISRIT